MTIVTGTTIGMHITPGNGDSTPPQVTIAYKRAELAVIPTAGTGATIASGTNTSDAYSSFAGFDFQSGFTSRTKLKQFISTGVASQNLIDNSNFVNALKEISP